MSDALTALLRKTAPGGEMALAYSGGLDSRFLAHMATRAGITVRALHVTGPHTPARERAYALDWAARAGIAVTVVAVDPLAMPELRDNPKDRCYHCKKAVFSALRGEAGLLPLCDGTNASDKGEYRPGLKALAELAVFSPLADAGLTKNAIRRMAAETALENPDQAARPCLLTRFAYGAAIDARLLATVDAAEQAVAALLARRGHADAPFRLRYESPGFPALHLGMPDSDSTDAGREDANLDAALAEELAARGFPGLPIRRMRSLSGFFDREAGTAVRSGKNSAGKTVILDRDGTLIAERHYLKDPDGVELLPGVCEGLALLRRHGYSLIVATNQAGVGRGYYSLDAMHTVNARMQTLLAERGVRLDAVYFCPHAPEAQCRCRKPAPGMLEEAAREQGIAFDASFVIGDKESDILFGAGAGMRAILVRTGYGADAEKQGTRAAYVADTLYDAALWITTRSPSP